MDAEQKRPVSAAVSGPGGSYKPKVKSSAAERESEGTEVLGKDVKASGGKGPCGGRAVDGGKREGMVGRPKHPDRRQPVATTPETASGMPQSPSFPNR